MCDRPQQRRKLRALRRSLDERERRRRDTALYRQLLRLPLFRNSRRIALYLPADGEAGTAAIVERAWEQGKEVYLPVLAPFLHNRLWFMRYTPHTPLSSNRFGIAEPPAGYRERVPGHALDLVLAPLVGFDASGNRLGMGGGFYDRSFAFLARRRHWRKPRLVGLAYDFQQLPGLPAQHWDVPLTAVVTDTGWHRFDKPSRKKQP